MYTYVRVYIYMRRCVCVCVCVCVCIKGEAGKNQVVLWLVRGLPGGSVVKNLPANAGDASLIPGWEDPQDKQMAMHSSILA